jgi:hypothetical protein
VLQVGNQGIGTLQKIPCRQGKHRTLVELVTQNDLGENRDGKASADAIPTGRQETYNNAVALGGVIGMVDEHPRRCAIQTDKESGSELALPTHSAFQPPAQGLSRQGFHSQTQEVALARQLAK